MPGDGLAGPVSRLLSGAWWRVGEASCTANPMTVAGRRSWKSASAEPLGSPHGRAAARPRRGGCAHRLARQVGSAPSPAAERETTRPCWWAQTAIP